MEVQVPKIGEGDRQTELPRMNLRAQSFISLSLCRRPRPSPSRSSAAAAAAAALQTLCGRGCLEKEGKIRYLCQSSGRRDGTATRHPQKKLKENRKILHTLKRGRDYLDTTGARADGQGDVQTDESADAAGICN